MNHIPTETQGMHNGIPKGFPAVVKSPLCAWCLSEQGITPAEVSHGICKPLADTM